MIEFKNIYKTFKNDLGYEKKVFENLNFKANIGDFITIIGSNGAGKSTFLNLLNGNVIPDSGEILLNNFDISKLEKYKRAKFISQVYQNPLIGTAPNMTVLENLSMAMNKGKKFGLSLGLDVKNIDFFKTILKTLDLGLENQLYTNVSLLSGGQIQCLSLIMATLSKPKILLLDEYTAALDPKTSNIIMEKTKEIIERENLISFMITHNMEDAIKYGNRLIMLHNGNIVFDFSKEEKEKLSVEKLLNLFKNLNAKIEDKDLF